MISSRRIALLSSLLLAFAACSQKQPSSPGVPGGEKPPTLPDTLVASATPATVPIVHIPETAANRKTPPAGAKVYFVDIKDGDVVTSPFKVGFGVDGLALMPAGSSDPDSGHHHLIIDADLPPQDAPLPANDHVRHFGKGQTGVELSLPPGTHTLQLEFADGAHLPFNPPVVSDRITITVQ
jgi:hypothetical protein